MKRILWISKHKPLQRQVNELKRIFGNNVEIIVHDYKVKDANHVFKLIKKFNADEVVTILPLSIIQRICEMGIKPLWSEMEFLHVCDYFNCNDFKNESDYYDISSKRHFRFKKFYRIKEVKMVLEEIS
jgi:hypothetical protein